MNVQEVNPDGDREVSRRPDGDLELPGGGDGFLVPPCERCGGVLKPNVVFFGDAIPPARAKLCAPWDLLTPQLSVTVTPMRPCWALHATAPRFYHRGLVMWSTTYQRLSTR